MDVSEVSAGGHLDLNAVQVVSGHSAGGGDIDDAFLSSGQQLFEGVVGGVGGNQDHFGVEADAGNSAEVFQNESNFLQLGVINNGVGVSQHGVAVGSGVSNSGLANSAAAAADVLHDDGVVAELLADGLDHQTGGDVDTAAGVIGNNDGDILGGESGCHGCSCEHGDSQSEDAKQCYEFFHTDFSFCFSFFL